jgi:hypothetical protein
MDNLLNRFNEINLHERNLNESSFHFLNEHDIQIIVYDPNQTDFTVKYEYYVPRHIIEKIPLFNNCFQLFTEYDEEYIELGDRVPSFSNLMMFNNYGNNYAITVNSPGSYHLLGMYDPPLIYYVLFDKDVPPQIYGDLQIIKTFLKINKN